MNVLIISGGTSNERSVSLKSGVAVGDALRANGHNVSYHDPKFNDLSKINKRNIDVAFPVTHGSHGEDGRLQEELEKLNFAYVGSDSKSSKICFNKLDLKKKLQKINILTPKCALANMQSIGNHELFSSPFVLKPYAEGSSVDTFIEREPEMADWGKINDVLLNRYPEMLLEELIEGTEITVPILGSDALPIVEIIPPEGQVFDYDNKYNGLSEELCPPRSISMELQEKAKQLALRVHKIAGCRHYSRTDMIIDKHNNIYVLETNTLPGMTDESLFPKSAKAAGISMQELCERLINLATAH